MAQITSRCAPFFLSKECYAIMAKIPNATILIAVLAVAAVAVCAVVYLADDQDSKITTKVLGPGPYEGYYLDVTLKDFESIGIVPGENIKAMKHATEYGIGSTGGTDGHLLHELGHVLTVSEATDLDGFLDDIVKHRNTVVGLEKQVPMKFVMAMASLSRISTHLPSSMVRKLQLIRYHGTKNCPE